MNLLNNEKTSDIEQNWFNTNLCGFLRIDIHTGTLLKINNKILEICSIQSKDDFQKEFSLYIQKSSDIWNEFLIDLKSTTFLENYPLEFIFQGKPSLHVLVNAQLLKERGFIDLAIFNNISYMQYTADFLVQRDRKAFQIVAEGAINCLNLKDLCQVIIDGLVDTFNFDVGSVMLYDDFTRMFHVVAYHDSTNTDEIPEPFSIDDPKYIHSHVGRTKQGVFAQDVKNDSFVLSFLNKHDIDSAIRALITWPLISSKKKLLGSLQLISLKPKELSEKDRDLFKSIAELFALAIERTIAENNLHKLNEELEKRVFGRTAELDAVNKELEAFSYSVSHDLRAPLRHIAGYIELIRRNIDTTNEKVNHYIETVLKSTKEMNDLIDDLLSFSRISRYELVNEEINLAQMINGIIDEFEPDIKERNILWKIKEMPIIKGDRSLIRIAIKNLISNAVKFTRTKEEAIIEVGIIFQDTTIEPIFYIKDNGVGFDMNFYDKLFGVFQRLHSDKEFEGTGIGLAMVKRIINKHNGTIWAESIKDKGSTFYFTMGRKEGN
ncbi:MAG: ATP-binding protein [Candidatus Thorarchaeota archaeon]